MTVSNVRQNILIDAQGSPQKLELGKPYIRYITVKNRGVKSARVVIWLKAKDANSQNLLRWYHLESAKSFETNYKISDKKRDLSLELAADGDEQDINLIFDVPRSAEPGIYNYEICVQDAQSEFPVTRSQQLQIPYFQQNLEFRKEPDFQVEPLTSSEEPHLLQPGERLPINIRVENRSHLVDRFFLFFPELDNSWFENYKETNPTDGLPLNPGETGNFQLALRPPERTPAGQYYSSIRLKSENTNQVFLGIIYFNIEVDQRLTFDLSPTSRKVPSSNSSFELKVSNPGNIQRHISFNVKDEENLFNYVVNPPDLLLNPGDEEQVILIPIARKKFVDKRSWKSEELEVPFVVEISNYQSPVEELQVPSFYLPENPSGTILWKPQQSPRPWLLSQLQKFFKYLLWLLILLALLALGRVVINLAYAWVWNSVVKPTLQPKVTEFTTTEKSYQAGKSQGIYLNWEVRNIGQLSKIEVIPVRNEVNFPKNLNYKFALEADDKSQQSNHFRLIVKNPTPEPNISTPSGNNAEQETCKKNKDITESTSSDITAKEELCCKKKSTPSNWLSPLTWVSYIDCHHVLPFQKWMSSLIQDNSLNTEVDIPFSYRLIDNKKTNFCKVENIPVDNSPSRAIWKIIYRNEPEMQTYKAFETKALQCRKMTGVTFELTSSPLDNKKTRVASKQLLPEIIKRQEEEKAKLQKQEGNYKFQIKLFTDQEYQTISDSKLIKDIFVAEAPPPPPPTPEPPLPQPEIKEFASKIPMYREAKPKDLKSKTQSPSESVKLSWVIANPENISSLSLKILRIGLNGSVSSDVKSYILDIKAQKGSENKERKVYALEKGKRTPVNCLFRNKLLTCENVPVADDIPGQYKFTLIAIPKKGEKAKHLKEVSKNIESVLVKPMLPEIINFKVNDQDTLTRPNHIFTVDPTKEPPNVFLTWKVKNPEQVKVELLPAPGAIAPSTDKIQYTLSPNPAAMTVTLRVTNQAGESVIRTVVLETVPKAMLPEKGTTTTAPQVAPAPPPDGAAPSSESELNPDSLPPFELPPRAN